MSSTILQPGTHSRSKRVVLLLFLIGALAVLAIAGYFYSRARAALPQLDGELRVPGLGAKVLVIRDDHGVPAIQAVSLDDLVLAQGYVTAQDRLWQMDNLRRSAAGELSETLGGQHLEQDREQRILGLRSVAHRSLESVSPSERSYLEAYARGVNAYIESHRDRLPLEFRVLHATPKLWTAEDSLVVWAQLNQTLNHGAYRMALLREKILAVFGPELTGEMFVNISAHDRLPSQPPKTKQTSELQPADLAHHAVKVSRPQSVPAAPGLENLYIPKPGSNNWVISGARTVSGRPLLSNDIHLPHQMPNFWYEVHLQSGTLDVAGISIPGVPFVMVGHNQHIAWGFSNVSPIAEDVYIETVNDHGQYQTPQGWHAFDHRREVIHVKAKPDVIEDVALTRHGPIISALIPGEKRNLTLRWTVYDGLHIPFFEVDAAQNWKEFQQALSGWGSLSLNAVYADTEGHIGYHATGHIPIRAAGDGSVPQNGADDSHEWKGYIPFDQLPNVFDPPWGVVATANGRITPAGYPYSITTGWEAPWRTERIYQVLESGKKLAPDDMLALQTDVYSAFDQVCARRFVAALDHATNLSSRALQARDLMRTWDGRVSIDSVAATIEFHSVWKLLRILLEAKLQAMEKSAKSDSPKLTFLDLHWSMTTIWLENVLLQQPKRWLPEAYSNYDAVLVAAVEAAVNAPEAPANLSEWKWGSGSIQTIQNPILGRLPLLRHWTGPGRVSQSGHGITVKQIGPNFGPSQRLTVDLSDLDHSTLNLVTGQSGNFLSPYYMDQWKAYDDGFSFTLPFSANAVGNTKAHSLVLVPAK